MDIRNSYRVDLRELEFILWEQFRVHETLLDHPMHQGMDQETVRNLLFQARDFAYREMGTLYQSTDREGCHWINETEVHPPKDFYALWEKFRAAEWTSLSAPPHYGGIGAPYVVLQSIYEMFFGANPSFMTYLGFCAPVLYLTETFGSDELRRLFCPPLSSARWSACFCMTEPEAGSDVGNIRTRATKQADGSYTLSGGKIFISAGYHDLAENTVYLVLARTQDAPPGTLGLSCFLVPKYRVAKDGSIAGDNHVRCIRLEDKMGLHACATAQLSFGDSGECQGFLLGDRENIGLRQLLYMMNQARISTGIFALGMASSAYLNAAEYAANRTQGTDFRNSFNPRAPKVPIIQHQDVRRMLLEMKSKVEGCRALIYKLSWHYSKSLALKQEKEPDQAALARHEGLVNLLTPIVKAYTSDQAWRISELAIQVHGGYGYIKDYPVEQYARDIKILSIWEGTNYIQAADLIRDKLAMGRHSKLLALYEGEVREFIRHRSPSPELAPLFEQLGSALDTLLETHALFGQWVSERKIDQLLGYATRFLEMMGEVSLGWLLLEAAQIAQGKLSQLPAEDPDEPFYRGKLLSAQFFFNNILPNVASTAQTIAREDPTPQEAGQDIFLERSQQYV
ncbi:acyl-CoA dehydrogenase [Marinobacteraceae bacterium S3BR75-40.1]